MLFFTEYGKKVVFISAFYCKINKNIILKVEKNFNLFSELNFFLHFCSHFIIVSINWGFN